METALQRTEYTRQEDKELAKKQTEQVMAIKPPNFQWCSFKLIGTKPLVQHRFSKKGEIIKDMEEGDRRKKNRKREPRDFEKDFRESMHIFDDESYGHPAEAFRKAMISACRTVGFVMTLAKLGIYVEDDGLDKYEKIPLVKLHGKPTMDLRPVRIGQTINIAARAMWPEWSIDLTVRFDADMFSAKDIANLLMRVGMQVGIGEGRPDSKSSTGMGWGLFRIAEGDDE